MKCGMYEHIDPYIEGLRILSKYAMQALLGKVLHSNQTSFVGISIIHCF
jgi:hypothetical protein